MKVTLLFQLVLSSRMVISVQETVVFAIIMSIVIMNMDHVKMIDVLRDMFRHHATRVSNFTLTFSIKLQNGRDTVEQSTCNSIVKLAFIYFQE